MVIAKKSIAVKSLLIPFSDKFIFHRSRDREGFRGLQSLAEKGVLRLRVFMLENSDSLNEKKLKAAFDENWRVKAAARQGFPVAGSQRAPEFFHFRVVFAVSAGRALCGWFISRLRQNGRTLAAVSAPRTVDRAAAFVSERGKRRQLYQEYERQRKNFHADRISEKHPCHATAFLAGGKIDLPEGAVIFCQVCTDDRKARGSAPSTWQIRTEMAEETASTRSILL